MPATYASAAPSASGGGMLRNMVLLALLFASASASSPSPSPSPAPAPGPPLDLVGMIEGTEGVFVTLRREQSNVSGTLRYRQPHVELVLNGVVAGTGEWILDELHPTTKEVTGKLRLTEPPPVDTDPPVAFIGTWTKPDGSGARAVTLQDRATALVTDAVVVVADTRLLTIQSRFDSAGSYSALPKVPRVLLPSREASRAAQQALKRRILGDVAGDPFKQDLGDGFSFSARTIECFVVVDSGSCGYRACSRNHTVVETKTGADRSGAAFFPAGADHVLRSFLQRKHAAHLAKSKSGADPRCAARLQDLRGATREIELRHLDVEPVKDGANIHLNIDHGDCAREVMFVSNAELRAAFPRFERCPG